MTDEPASIVPDDKDWTWVLAQPCPECGYRSGVPHDDIPALIRGHSARWQQVLTRPDTTSRPDPTVWSPLEYACHVRDVYRIFRERAQLMLDTDDPQFENWDQDQTALESRYWEADPDATSAALALAGEDFARTFESVTDDQWQRPGRRSNGSVFTVETLAWYALHDDVHHLHDVAG